VHFRAITDALNLRLYSPEKKNSSSIYRSSSWLAQESYRQIMNDSPRDSVERFNFNLENRQLARTRNFPSSARRGGAWLNHSPPCSARVHGDARDPLSRRADRSGREAVEEAEPRQKIRIANCIVWWQWDNHCCRSFSVKRPLKRYRLNSFRGPLLSQIRGPY